MKLRLNLFFVFKQAKKYMFVTLAMDNPAPCMQNLTRHGKF